MSSVFLTRSAAVPALCALLGVFAVPPAFAQHSDRDRPVPVTGGTFMMGTEAADIPALRLRYDVNFPGVFRNETPAHKVTVSDFRIDPHEVTYARFAEFLEAVPEWRKDRLHAREHNGRYLEDWHEGRFPRDKARLPVAFITWSAAQSFCRWRGGRLPTEAEWEWVARAGDSREFPWGNDLPSASRANYGGSGIGRSVEVGSYPPNESGVHDLAGNVWEFLLDEWSPEYQDRTQIDPVVGGTVSDADIRDIAGRRSVRGASFGGSIVNLRTRWRDSHRVGNAVEFVGFRCAYEQ